MADFAAILRHYKKYQCAISNKELDDFRKMATVQSAIERAAQAIDSSGKRYSHQRRIKKKAILRAAKLLCAASLVLECCEDFAKLHDAVESTVSGVFGIGPLYIYDTALRIGAKLGLAPEHIYLHAGARVGAARLGIDVRSKFITKNQVPRLLRELSAAEIEDVLCIYKDCFGAGSRKGLAELNRSC
jgi:hypothetical protein